MKIGTYFIILFIFLSTASFSKSEKDQIQLPENQSAITQGENLFKTYCNNCHNIYKQNQGPALASITRRRPLNWLMEFIKNPSQKIHNGDKYAQYQYKVYGNVAMPSFTEFSDGDIKNILAYIRSESASNLDSLTVIQDSQEALDIIEKAKERFENKDPSEIDYYSLPKRVVIPTDKATIAKGRQLYNAQCETCHKLDRDYKGPALNSVYDKRPLSWTYAFINNPREVIESGDDYANYLVTQYGAIMPSFSFLKGDDITSILAYINSETNIHFVPNSGPSSLIEVDYVPGSVNKDYPEPDLETAFLVKFVTWSFVMISVGVILYLIRKFYFPKSKDQEFIMKHQPPDLEK